MISFNVSSVPFSLSLSLCVQALIIRPVMCWWPSSSSPLILHREFILIVWRATLELETRSPGKTQHTYKYCLFSLTWCPLIWILGNSWSQNDYKIFTEMLEETENHRIKLNLNMSSITKPQFCQFSHWTALKLESNSFSIRSEGR